MKVIEFTCGLGNQMFQYAFLVAMREHTGDKCLMDITWYDRRQAHNGFEIDKVFCISSEIADVATVGRLTRYARTNLLHRIYKHLLPLKKTEFRERGFYKFYPDIFARGLEDTHFRGFWQSYRYFHDFRDIILSEFCFRHTLDERNLQVYQRVLGSKTCISVHVRRGDYLKHKLYHGLCGVNYYIQAINKAVELIGSDAAFLIFSNDTEWCKENIVPLIGKHEYCIVDWNTGSDSYKDMQLMSACRLNIIANSSFSWWAAYLNRRTDQIVISPRKWINMHMRYKIQMPHWILI